MSAHARRPGIPELPSRAPTAAKGHDTLGACGFTGRDRPRVGVGKQRDRRIVERDPGEHVAHLLRGRGLKAGDRLEAGERTIDVDILPETDNPDGEAIVETTMTEKLKNQIGGEA